MGSGEGSELQRPFPLHTAWETTGQDLKLELPGGAMSGCPGWRVLFNSQPSQLHGLSFIICDNTTIPHHTSVTF